MNYFFIEDTHRWLNEIIRYEGKPINKSLMGYNNEFDYEPDNKSSSWAIQRLLYCGHNRILNPQSIFNIFPKELIRYILFIIYLTSNKIYDYADSLKIPLNLISIITGYNIDKSFLKLIEDQCKFIDDEYDY